MGAVVFFFILSLVESFLLFFFFFFFGFWGSFNCSFFQVIMASTTSLFLVFATLIFLQFGCHASISDRTKMLNQILNPDVYDSRVRPNEGSSPVKININCFIASLNTISESDMDYTIDIYLRQSWIDQRLSHNSSKFLVVPPRFTLTLSCPMALHKFPFDIQTCGFKMESYGYGTDEVVFNWREDQQEEGAVALADDTQIPTYELVQTDGKKIATTDCTKVYTTGKFTCISAEMTFGRQIGYFLFNTFIPSFIITSLTWLGFWLLPSPSVTRVTLISICLLSTIGLIEAAKKTTPKVSYIVALDVWMVMSLVFIVVAMLETVFVAWMYQKGEQGEISEDKLEPGTRRKRSCCNWKGCAIKVDILSRLLIPALYFGWAGFYWFIYTKFDL